ncbi:MAG: hypothetical protein IPJ41_03690 [Phycisphaerales bacterium]|nr:hypothetical protein [Phycisphaerales bacterium]
MRRSRLSTLVGLAWGALVLACALGWVVGRVFSDRYLWSQPVSWIPTPLLLAPVWIRGAVAWRRCRAARRRGGRAPVRAGAAVLAGWAVGIVGAAGIGHLLFVELGLHRAVLRPRSAGPVARVVFWNQAGVEAGDISSTFLPLGPTLFVLANRHSDTRTRDIAQAFIDTGEAHAAVGWPFDLFSRGPIRRWGSMSLGLEGRSRRGDGSMREDSGWAAWFEVETAAGPLTVWAIDMPSDPSLPKYALARAAGEAISVWRGSARVVVENGQQSEDAVGFPKPDVIVGDFNIPRGSASLAEFLRASGAGAMRSAFDESGWGWARSWPRATPLLAIDQCFVGSRVRAVEYRAMDPGVGGHRAIVVDVEGNEAEAPEAAGG